MSDPPAQPLDPEKMRAAYRNLEDRLMAVENANLNARLSILESRVDTISDQHRRDAERLERLRRRVDGDEIVDPGRWDAEAVERRREALRAAENGQ